jgi:hypothetical protein
MLLCELYGPYTRSASNLENTVNVLCYWSKIQCSIQGNTEEMMLDIESILFPFIIR